jgi:hypothetical protein
VAWLPLAGSADTFNPVHFAARMKTTDDYKAKYRLWAENPRVIPPAAAPRIPHFKSRRFSSHAEMNEWKQSLIRQLAQSAPGK